MTDWLNNIYLYELYQGTALWMGWTRESCYKQVGTDRLEATLLIDLTAQLSHDVTDQLSVKPWCYRSTLSPNVGFLYTAISRKVVGKSARDNHERYCGQFWVHCSSEKFERIAREALDICLRVLKESNKSMFDSYRVSNSELVISHITFRDCRVHIFSNTFSRNSCILTGLFLMTKYQISNKCPGGDGMDGHTWNWLSLNT